MSWARSVNESGMPRNMSDWHTHSRECLSTGARRARPRALSLGHSFICQVRDSFFCIHGFNRMLMNKKCLAPCVIDNAYQRCSPQPSYQHCSPQPSKPLAPLAYLRTDLEASNGLHTDSTECLCVTNSTYEWVTAAFMYSRRVPSDSNECLIKLEIGVSITLYLGDSIEYHPISIHLSTWRLEWVSPYVRKPIDVELHRFKWMPIDFKLWVSISITISQNAYTICQNAYWLGDSSEYHPISGSLSTWSGGLSTT